MKIDRFERKWIYRSGNYINLINALVRSKLFFTYHYPSRKVNSIYFDDSKEFFEMDSSLGLKISLILATIFLMSYFIYPNSIVNIVLSINVI